MSTQPITEETPGKLASALRLMAEGLDSGYLTICHGSSFEVDFVEPGCDVAVGTIILSGHLFLEKTRQ